MAQGNPFLDNTSQSTDFTLTGSQVVRESFDLLQMGVEGEDLTQDQYQRGINSLNLVMRSMQAEGVLLSSYEDGVLWLDPGVERYIPEDLDRARAANSYQQYRLAEDEPEGSTLIQLDSDSRLDFGLYTNPQEGWQIGILLDDGSLAWSEIVSTQTDIYTVLIEDPLTGDASAGNAAFVYQDTIAPIERVSDVRRADDFINDQPINFIARNEYFRQPTKYSSGVVTEAYWQRRRGKGEFYLWPVPQDSRTLIKFSYERVVEDLKSATDQIDLRKPWLEPIVAEVALRLAMKYRVPEGVVSMVRAHRDEVYAKARAHSDSVYDLKITMRRNGR